MKIITVGQIIKESRSKFGYSTSELAKLVNVKTIEINKIESGKYTFPNSKILKRLSKVLKLEYSDLMYASGLGDLKSTYNKYVEDNNSEAILDAKNISKEYIKQRKKMDRSMILELVDRIEIHEDKSLDLYLKIKPLEQMK